MLVSLSKFIVLSRYEGLTELSTARSRAYMKCSPTAYGNWHFPRLSADPEHSCDVSGCCLRSSTAASPPVAATGWKSRFLFFGACPRHRARRLRPKT